MVMNCKIKRNRGVNNYTLTFRGLTRGMLLATRNALEKHAIDGGSAVGADVLAFIDGAVQTSADDELKEALQR